MNAWPRRMIVVLLFVVPPFGVANISGLAQSVDSDTAEVGVIVLSSECLYESNSVSSSVVAYSANGWRSDLGPMMFAQAEAPEEGDCPDETAIETETSTATDRAIFAEIPTATATSTDAVAGSSSTAPVVAQLPDTGVAPSNSASTPVLAVMLTAGFLLMAGGVIISRPGASRPVE